MRAIEEETRIDRLRAIALILVKENRRLRAALRELHGTDDGNLELELQYLQEQLAKWATTSGAVNRVLSLKAARVEGR